MVLMLGKVLFMVVMEVFECFIKDLCKWVCEVAPAPLVITMKSITFVTKPTSTIKDVIKL